MASLSELETQLTNLMTELLTVSQAAQKEREKRKMRQAEGIAAAKKAGVRFGRPAISPPANFGELVLKWEQGNMKLSEVLAALDMKESTFYRKLREYRNAMGQNVLDRT